MRRVAALVGWLLGAIAFRLLVGCATEDLKPPATPGVLLGEQYCAAYDLPCGKVYEFAAAADSPLGHVELCVLEHDVELAERVYGPSMLSTDPRFDDGNLCLWQCPSVKGCNAYNSCFCPMEAP